MRDRCDNIAYFRVCDENIDSNIQALQKIVCMQLQKMPLAYSSKNALTCDLSICIDYA